MRNFNESGKKSLLDEMQTLNLTKYITEITTAIAAVKSTATAITTTTAAAPAATAFTTTPS